jgi:alpha-L-fucosidase
MFIHWGPVSLDGRDISWSRDPNPAGPNPGGIQASEYDHLYERFNPVKFDAKQVASLAKNAGMKYIVFTTKHHDGFCEFDSKYTDYKITSP